MTNSRQSLRQCSEGFCKNTVFIQKKRYGTTYIKMRSYETISNAANVVDPDPVDLQLKDLPDPEPDTYPYD